MRALQVKFLPSSSGPILSAGGKQRLWMSFEQEFPLQLLIAAAKELPAIQRAAEIAIESSSPRELAIHELTRHHYSRPNSALSTASGQSCM